MFEFGSNSSIDEYSYGSVLLKVLFKRIDALFCGTTQKRKLELDKQPMAYYAESCLRSKPLDHLGQDFWIS